MDRENPQAQEIDEFDNWLNSFKKAPNTPQLSVGAVREPPLRP
jgi:hypothetical protein